MSSKCCPRPSVSSWLLWLVLVLVLVGQGVAAETECLTLKPVPKSEEVALDFGAGSGGQVQWPSHSPLDLGSYVPMPISKGDVSKGGAESAYRQVMYDVQTKQQTFGAAKTWDSLAGAARTSGRRGRDALANSGGRGGLVPLNFSDMTRDFNAVDYPYCVNCKLFMTFLDEAGEVVYRAYGSGILVDSMHVLTAAHCLYVHDVNTGEAIQSIDAWADEVVVVPAYEEESRPYGDATAVQLSASEGWTVDRDYDYDIGIIRLDRPVGVITGWIECASEEDPFFYTENTFSNLGYPDLPPYDGEYMYFWEGAFDRTDCDPVSEQWFGNTVSIDRPIHPGHGGSGAYVKTLDGQMVYAVASHESDGRGHFVRLTEDKLDELGEAVATGTPMEPDLIPFFTQIDEPAVDRGRPIEEMWFLLYNNSQTQWSGRILIAAFLSQDKVISRLDTHLGQFYLDTTFPPKATLGLFMPPVRVPSDTESGGYYVGIYLLSEDSDNSNNICGVQDVAPVVIGYDKLANNVPQRVANGPRTLAFEVVNSDWCCVGIAPTANYQLWTYTSNDLIGSYARSNQGGSARDFVVVNGHLWEPAMHYAKVGQMLGGTYEVEATWDISDLKLGAEYTDVMDAKEVHEVYEVNLKAGTPYQLDLTVTSGTADLSVYVFEPTEDTGSPTDYGWKADENGSGHGEQLSFTPNTSGFHGIVVINENFGTSEFSLVVQP